MFAAMTGLVASYWWPSARSHQGNASPICLSKDVWKALEAASEATPQAAESAKSLCGPQDVLPVFLCSNPRTCAVDP